RPDHARDALLELALERALGVPIVARAGARQARLVTVGRSDGPAPLDGRALGRAGVLVHVAEHQALGATSQYDGKRKADELHGAPPVGKDSGRVSTSPHCSVCSAKAGEVGQSRKSKVESRKRV